MISAKRIGELIENPAGVKLEELEGLEKSLEKYPYAAVLRMVLLKGKAIHHSADFETSLENSANHIMDRAYLFDFLQNPDAEDETEIVEADVEVEIPEPVLEKEVVETPELKAEETDEEETFEEEVIEEKILEKKEVEKEQEVDIVSPEVIEEEVIEESLSSEVLSEVVHEAFQNELREENSPAEKEEINEDELSFVEWLKLKKEGRLPEKKMQAKVVENPIVAEIKTKKSSKKGLSKSDINDLLDRFIEAEPSISRPTEDFYSPAKTAKQSLEEQESLVTETLAKIHLLQKNYSKAIETYKRLILVYPEKKTYFATQIEKIRAQKTDQ